MSPIHFVTTNALTAALRHGKHPATAYFSTKNGQLCNSTKCMGPKMHGKLEPNCTANELFIDGINK